MDIIVESMPEGTFQAHVDNFPHLQVVAASREEARFLAFQTYVRSISNSQTPIKEFNTLIDRTHSIFILIDQELARHHLVQDDPNLTKRADNLLNRVFSFYQAVHKLSQTEPITNLPGESKPSSEQSTP